VSTETNERRCNHHPDGQDDDDDDHVEDPPPLMMMTMMMMMMMMMMILPHHQAVPRPELLPCVSCQGPQRRPVVAREIQVHRQAVHLHKARVISLGCNDEAF
jgi:hypothetical protein